MTKKPSGPPLAPANVYVHESMDFAELVAAAKALGLRWLLLDEAAPAGHGSS